MMLGSGTGRRTAVIFRDWSMATTSSGGGRPGDEMYVTPIVVAAAGERMKSRERKVMRESGWDIVAGFGDSKLLLYRQGYAHYAGWRIIANADRLLPLAVYHLLSIGGSLRLQR